MKNDTKYLSLAQPRYPYAGTPGSAYMHAGHTAPIRVRIAVAVSPEGTWNAAGYGGPGGYDPRDMKGFADCALDRVDTNHTERCQIRWVEVEIPPHSEPVSMGRILEDRYHASKELAEGLAHELLEYWSRDETPPADMVVAQRAAELEAIDLRGMWEAYAS
jgi:hypothetical protein